MKLVKLLDANSDVSPRLGIRFTLTVGELTVYGPDGRPFQAPADIAAERAAAERAAEEERRRGAEERDRAARLAAKLRELGVDPDAV
jgi:hypothetical protein